MLQPFIGAGMGDGNVRVGIVISIHRGDRAAGDILGRKISNGEVDGIEDGEGVSRGTRTIQKEVVEGHTANGVKEFLDPGHTTTGVIGVVHGGFNRSGIAAQAGNLQHLAAAAGAAAVGVGRIGTGNGFLQVDIVTHAGADDGEVGLESLVQVGGRGGDGSGGAQTLATAHLEDGGTTGGTVDGDGTGTASGLTIEGYVVSGDSRESGGYFVGTAGEEEGGAWGEGGNGGVDSSGVVGGAISGGTAVRHIDGRSAPAGSAHAGEGHGRWGIDAAAGHGDAAGHAAGTGGSKGHIKV